MAKTVLIVEDNELNMKLFHDLLEAHGYETVGTRNGIEALDLARKHHPDLILMDLNLPVMDGWEASRQLKADPATRDIPIIALTAHAMAGDREKAMAAGTDDFDTKPVSFDRLMGKIKQQLQRVGKEG